MYVVNWSRHKRDIEAQVSKSTSQPPFSQAYKIHLVPTILRLSSRYKIQIKHNKPLQSDQILQLGEVYLNWSL